MRHSTLRLIPLLALPLAGCLENEEEITVNPDGSVLVTVTARGDAVDLAAGFPVPLHGPWVPAGEDTTLWLQNIGPDTGGTDTQDAARNRAQALWGADADEVELSARAHFSSVADLPRSFAPRDASYRSAYLERETRHEVRELEGRRVHVFERTYGPRDHRRFDPWERMQAEASDGLKAAWEENGAETLAEWWPEIRDLMRTNLIAAAADLTRDALLSIYTDGDATLAPAGLESVAAVVRRRAALKITDAALAEVRRFLEEDGEAGQDPDDLEGDVRESVRRTLTEELPKLGIEERVVFAVLGRLEERLTAMDHDGDLEDENFRVVLRLPGTIVGGNYLELDESGRAVWEFEGAELVEGLLRLRAVSLER